MYSKSHRQTLTTPLQIHHDALIAGFIDDLDFSGRFSKAQLSCYRSPARHFLAWLTCNDMALETVDGLVIHRFLQHDCDGCTVAPSSVRLRWTKRHTCPKLMHFVRYLEREGWISTPGDLDDNLRLLADFLDRLRADGHASSTIRHYHNICAGLIVWLHLSRLPLRELTPATCEQYWHRSFICSLPGVFCGQRAQSSDSDKNRSRLPRFMEHLVAIGQIPPLESPPQEKPLPDILEKFSDWLEHTRGLCRSTCRDHVQRISAILPDLGTDPDAYDAARIRKVLWEQIEHRSRAYAQSLSTSMRVYLRFLVSEGRIQATLVEAVPTVPQWRLSTLPRYISADDIERAIETCDDQPVGLRNRAILLLLARLALRAGDIVDLRLDDIRWEQAEIRV